MREREYKYFIWDAKDMVAEINALREYKKAADYYINRLEAVQKRKVVRDMCEAQSYYVSECNHLMDAFNFH